MLVLDGICFLVNFRFAGRETARGSNPRHDQNLIYFDLSKLAQRPLLGRHLTHRLNRSRDPNGDHIDDQSKKAHPESNLRGGQKVFPEFRREAN